MATYEDWVSVFRTSTDYEGDLVRDRLDDSGIPAVVLTQRDHAFNLNVGDLADVHVMVPPDKVDDAVQVLEGTLTDEELEEAALGADPDAPPAHDTDEESMLDSGHESTHFSPPEDEEGDGDEDASS